MSANELRNELDLLSYTEQLSIMEYLITLLKKRQPVIKEETEPSWLNKTFSLMDTYPVTSNGQKWTREELYER